MRKLSIILLLIGTISAVAGPVFAMPGDVTGDGRIDIADAILGLRILAHADLAGQTIRISAAVNGDGRIGMAEAIYILQAISGLRSIPLGIVSTSPAEGAAGIAANAIIAARFNQPVDITTVNTTTILLKDAENQSISGSIYCNGTTVQFIPSLQLSEGPYRAEITTGVRDPAGNPLADKFSWSFLASAAAAPSGSLDAGYGLAGNGTVIVSFGGTDEEARAVALQPDGKAVVGGYAYVAGVQKFALLRLEPDGLLDASFGSNGIVTTAFAPSNWDSINALAIQQDGKIVAAGGYSAFALARYNADGSPDNDFGFRGAVRTSAGISQSAAYGVAIQSDGKIVAGGWSDQSGSAGGAPYGARFTLIRYNRDGSLDPTFGSGGISRTLVAGYTATIRAIAIQPDGKIVTAGYAYNGSKFVFAFARFNSDGTVDGSFGTDSGAVVPMVDGQEEVCNALGLQQDGSIVAAGETVLHPTYNAAGDFALIRLSPQGAPDSNFGSGGKAITDYDGVDNRAGGLAIQLDGRLVAAGFAFNRGFALARYKGDGSLDTAFGNGGKVTTNAGGLSMAHAVAIQDNGRIVAAGFTNYPKKFAITRFLP